MESITRPFDFQKHISMPPRALVLTPFLDLCFIFLFVLLYASKFLFAPGVSVALPLSAQESTQGASASAILTLLPDYSNSNDGGFVQPKVIFRGEIFPVGSLEDKLKRSLLLFQEKNPVLLVKADKSVSLQQLVQVFEVAIESGFSSVHFATQMKSEELPDTWFGSGKNSSTNEF